MMRKLVKMMVMAAVVALLGGMAWGTVGVTNVTVQQRYPWNGLVDIDYEVVCDEPDADVWVWPDGWDNDLNQRVTLKSLSGEGAAGPVKPGAHRMTWDMGEGNADFHSSAFSVKIHAISGGAPYMAVDLSGGANAEAYPVEYLANVPDGEWSDEYKTTKLLLRLILPGTFLMGSPEGELGRGGGETQHEVTITKPFYMGVFEVTQKQWKLVTGSNPSDITGDVRPVTQVSYDMIRGAELGANWPSDSLVDADSFLGKLRAKTGWAFDLPTEAQWEYACRAGTTTALNSGKDLTATDTCANMAEVGRYQGNTNDGKGGYRSYHTKVGSYLPNEWGLYDMHGNVWAHCLDWFANYGTEPVANPLGADSGTNRVIRGGSFYWAAHYCRAASRDGVPPSDRTSGVGLRLVCPVGQ